MGKMRTRGQYLKCPHCSVCAPQPEIERHIVKSHGKQAERPKAPQPIHRTKTDNTMTTNAQKIKQARKGLRMSQSEFARALGLSRKATVSDWERGKKSPAPYVWIAIESLQNKIK